MARGWFTQGIITNLVSAGIVGGGGVIAALVVRRAAIWAIPAMYGLGTFALLSVIVTYARLGLFKAPRAKLMPGNAKTVIRDWLDKANVAVQNSPIDGWPFNYVATIDGKKIAIGQDGKNRAYLSVSTSLTFTEEDNQALESGPGGIAGVVKALRVALAVSRIMYAGIEKLLKQITISKRAFIGDGFLEHELHEAVLEVESGLNMASEIAAIPAGPPKQTSQ